MSDTPTFARWDRSGPFTTHCITCAEATARATAAKAKVEVLREALDSVPIPGKHEHAEHFYTRMENWLNGPYRRAALQETDNG